MKEKKKKKKRRQLLRHCHFNIHEAFLILCSVLRYMAAISLLVSIFKVFF